MNASELDRIRQSYRERTQAENCRYLQPAHVLALQQRERMLLAVLKRHAESRLAFAKILDVGCGYGDLIRRFVDYGVDPTMLHGIELMPERVLEARRLAPHVSFVCGDCANLPYRDGHFDIVAQTVVFSSIVDEGLKAAMASEMLRVLQPNGLILWYDFWINPINRSVRGVGVAEIRRLFPGCQLDVKRMTLAPPLARLLAPRSILLCQLLERVPFLLSHLFVVIRRGWRAT